MKYSLIGYIVYSVCVCHHKGKGTKKDELFCSDQLATLTGDCPEPNLPEETAN